MNFLELRLPSGVLLASGSESVPVSDHRLSQGSLRFGRAGWMKPQRAGSSGELYIMIKMQWDIPLRVIGNWNSKGDLPHYLDECI